MQLSDRLSTRRQAVILALVGVVPSIMKLAQKLAVDEPMVGNARYVWQPVAHGVLNGAMLYANNIAQWDNKPPLWHFLGIGAEVSGHYMVVMFVLIGIANGLTALLIWKLCRERGFESVSLVAAIGYLGMLFLFGGMTKINPRQFAAVALVGAFLLKRPVYRGIAIAVAGLFSQFSILAIPAVLYDSYRQHELDGQSVGLFCLAGLSTVAVSYGLVGAIWGSDAFIAAFKDSFLAFGGYVDHYDTSGTVAWDSPVLWLYFMYVRVMQILPFAFFATLGLQNLRSSLLTSSVIAIPLLLLATPIRPTPWYWVPAFPFIAILAAVGIQKTISSSY